MSSFKIGLAQIKPILGDLEANLQIHLNYVARALAEGVQLLIFPELSLTGYYLKDLVPSVAFRLNDQTYLGRLLDASRGLDLVVGFVEEDQRHRFYIASGYVSGGKILYVHRKVYLPTYGIYQDGRFFAAGNSFESMNSSFGRMGILICEDAWHMSSAYLLWLEGADILVIVNAMPAYGFISQDEVQAPPELSPRFNQVYAELLTCFVAYCNRVGVEDGITFGGGSVVLSPRAEVLAKAPYFEEALVVAEVDLDEIPRVRQQLPLLRDEKLDVTLREMTRIQLKGHQSLALAREAREH